MNTHKETALPHSGKQWINGGTKDGLATIYLLFVMELAPRRVHFAGSTTNPDDLWMLQVARNLSDADDGFLRGKKYLLMDRDTKFSEAFRSTLEQASVRTIRLPPRSPDLNPHIERFMRSLKDECLYRIIFFGATSLRNAVREFLVHYRRERNHQTDRVCYPYGVMETAYRRQLSHEWRTSP